MKHPFKIRHEIVEFIPKERETGVLYVSIPYATAVHDCFCGCATKVVTPISPVGWQLTFDGENVSLWPSIGNWSFACRSHYFIKKGAVVWADDMSEDEIAFGRARDREAREAYLGIVSKAAEAAPQAAVAPSVKSEKKKAFWSRLFGSW
jgi:hypothetical protein